MHLNWAVLNFVCSDCYSGRIEITIIFCATSLWHRHSLNTKSMPTFAGFAMGQLSCQYTATGTLSQFLQ